MHVLGPCLLELGHWSLPVLGLRFTSAPLFSDLQTQAEFHHQLTWVSRLQTIDCGTFSVSIVT